MKKIATLHINHTYSGYSINCKLHKNQSENLFIVFETHRSKAITEEKINGCTSTIIDFATSHSISNFGVEYKGPGINKIVDFNVLKSNGITIDYIIDKNPIPHNEVKKAKIYVK